MQNEENLELPDMVNDFESTEGSIARVDDKKRIIIF